MSKEPKIGRPPHGDLDDPEVVTCLCERLISGASMVKACDGDDMPAPSTVYLRMTTDDKFRTIIARARDAQQDAIIDETVDMADAATIEDHQVVKLRIWARQWRAGKLASKRYGEKVVNEHVGAGGGPIETIHGEMTTERAAELYAQTKDSI